MHTTSDHRMQLVEETHQGAIKFMKTGKAEGEFGEAVQRLIDNDGIFEVMARLWSYERKGDVPLASEKLAFSDKYVEAEIERQDGLAFQHRADVRRQMEA